MRWSALLPCLMLFLASASCAGAEQIGLAPPATQVGIRVYGLGLVPIDGRFTRFHGTLSYDRADRTSCRIDLVAEVASLAGPNETIRNDIVGPEFMDAAHYPLLTFHGACQGNGIAGQLEMHGVLHGLALDLDRQHGRLVAEGHLLRANWGMTARPFTVGRTVRITVVVTLPNASQPGGMG